MPLRKKSPCKKPNARRNKATNENDKEDQNGEQFLKRNINIYQGQLAKAKETITNLEKNFKVMKKQLINANREMLMKNNILNEFKAMRNDLMREYENVEARFSEQEMTNERNLNDVQNKSKTTCHLLRKEIERKMVELATKFPESSYCENISFIFFALCQEMDSITKVQDKFKVLIDKHEEHIDSNIFKEFAETEKNFVLQKNMHLFNVIAKLLEAFEKSESNKKDKRINEDIQDKIQQLTDINKKLSYKVLNHRELTAAVITLLTAICESIHPKEYNYEIAKCILFNLKNLSHLISDSNYSVETIFDSKSFLNLLHATNESKALTSSFSSTLKHLQVPSMIESNCKCELIRCHSLETCHSSKLMPVLIKETPNIPFKNSYLSNTYTKTPSHTKNKTAKEIKRSISKSFLGPHVMTPHESFEDQQNNIPETIAYNALKDTPYKVSEKLKQIENDDSYFDFLCKEAAHVVSEEKGLIENIPSDKEPGYSYEKSKKTTLLEKSLKKLTKTADQEYRSKMLKNIHGQAKSPNRIESQGKFPELFKKPIASKILDQESKTVPLQSRHLVTPVISKIFEKPEISFQDGVDFTKKSSDDFRQGNIKIESLLHDKLTTSQKESSAKSKTRAAKSKLKTHESQGKSYLVKKSLNIENSDKPSPSKKIPKATKEVGYGKKISTSPQSLSRKKIVALEKSRNNSPLTVTFPTEKDTKIKKRCMSAKNFSKATEIQKLRDRPSTSQKFPKKQYTSEKEIEKLILPKKKLHFKQNEETKTKKKHSRQKYTLSNSESDYVSLELDLSGSSELDRTLTENIGSKWLDTSEKDTQILILPQKILHIQQNEDTNHCKYILNSSPDDQSHKVFSLKEIDADLAYEKYRLCEQKNILLSNTKIQNIIKDLESPVSPSTCPLVEEKTENKVISKKPFSTRITHIFQDK